MDLVEARKKARYTQEEVANLLGISRPTYARMEKSPQDISIKEARSLAKIFEIPVEEIFFAEKV